MTREELDKLKYALSGMCNVMGVKPLDDAGMAYWTMTLKDCDYQDVRDALFEWGQTQRFCPKPAEILQIVKAKNGVRHSASFEEAEQEHKKFEPMAPELMHQYTQSMQRAANKNAPVDVWARQCMIKEAYGFALTPFVKSAWRRALHKEGYNFEDTKGVFPLDNYPDERTSIYHQGATAFITEYESKHGFNLVYDKEFVFKRYPSSPLRYDGRGMAQRSA